MKRAPLLLACAAVFLDAAGYGIVVPTVPLRATELNLPPFLLGLIFSAYPLIHLVVTLPLGLLCDRWGRKRVLVLGMVMLSVSSLSFSFASSFPQLFLSRGVQGMAELGGYPLPFRFWSLLSLLLGLAALLVLEEPPRRSRPSFSLLRFLRDPDALLSCSVALLIWMGFGFLEPFAPPYLSSRLGLTQGEIGGMFGLAALFLAVSRPLFGFLSDRFGRRRVIGWGLLACASSFPLVLFVDSVAEVTAVFCLMGLAIGIPLSSALPLITEAVPEAGAASALFLMAYSVGHLAGPLAGGAVLERWNLASLLYPYSLLLLVLALLSLRVRR